MAEMRSEVPRHEERGKMALQRRGNENFASKEAALLPAGMDSADGQSVRKEAKEESGKISEMLYEWQNRPEESEDIYKNRLSLMNNEEPNASRRQRETNSEKKARRTPKVEAKDAEAGKAQPPVTDAGKPEESVSEAGNAEESVTAGSGKSAMNQDVIGLSYTLDEEILQQMLQYKLDHFGNSFIVGEAEEKEGRAILKATQEKMAMIKKFLQKLPTKDLLEALNRTTEPAANPSSMTIQNYHVDEKKLELAKKTADEEMKAYLYHRECWESSCCSDTCDHFGQITTLGSMQYAHYTPGRVRSSFAETLQVFSMELKLKDQNAGGFKFPLSVYGMVAVRDNLDSRLNMLFSCNRIKAQKLTHADPFLLLTGPSRAIVSKDSVYFEIHLREKGAAASQDKPLMTCVRSYAGGSNTALCFNNVMCTLEVCLRTVKPAVQATIMCVQIVKKKKLWPLNFPYGGLVSCTPLPRTTDIDGNQKIVLVESKGSKFPHGDFGYVHLKSQVVSVEVGGGLEVVIQVYNESGAVAAESYVHFEAQNCQVRQKHCFVGQAQVNVTVAWSVVSTNMDDVVYED